MKIEALLDLLHAVPFVPFDIVLVTGERVRVGHPDYVGVNPTHRVVGVAKDNGAFRVVNWSLVVSLDVESSAAA